MMKIGVGYRQELVPWLAKRRNLHCIELTAEHFYDAPKRLEAFSKWRNQASRQPECFVHGLGLSLGTPGPLDQQRLKKFEDVARAVGASWVSEHVAFTRTHETDLGHLNPLPPTRESLEVIAEHVQQLAAFCRRPLLVENITSHVQLQGELSEPDFLNELCARGGCALLLDITNLYVNSRNHRFDPVEWLHRLDPKYIQQLHIVGYSCRDGRYIDDHSQAVQPELLELALVVIQYARVKAIVLERDDDIRADHEMDAEIAKLESLCGKS